VTPNRVLALGACLAAIAAGAAADELPLDAAAARQAMLCLTNYARARAGLPPLTANALLDAAGQAKLRDDVSCGEFSHTPCGRPFADVFAPYLAGARGYRVGENIALGGGEFATPRSTLDGWLGSAAHRANILAAGFRELGIGYVPGITFLGLRNVALWAQEFGSRSTPARAAATGRAAARMPVRTRSGHARTRLPLAVTRR
jgi:uncharacterized protein YkwD